MKGTLSTLAFGAVLTCLALAGCESLPRSGPDHKAIASQALVYDKGDGAKPSLNYALFDLTPRVLSYFPQQKQQTFTRGFGAGRRGAPTLPLGVGDVVEVTLFESSAGGLFIPAEAGSRPGNFISLPQQMVNSDGTITIPYAGRLVAAGRTTAQVQSDIIARLKDRAIEPQVVINLVRSRSSEIAVLGDVNSPNKLELNPGGERVLDVLSRAGGISSPNRETTITLQRNGATATVPFDLLLSTPRENIYVYPGDVVFANRDRRTFLAFGASGLNGRVDFEDSDLTLAEAVAKAGGLPGFAGRSGPGLPLPAGAAADHHGAGRAGDGEIGQGLPGHHQGEHARPVDLLPRPAIPHVGQGHPLCLQRGFGRGGQVPRHHQFRHLEHGRPRGRCRRHLGGHQGPELTSNPGRRTGLSRFQTSGHTLVVTIFLTRSKVTYRLAFRICE